MSAIWNIITGLFSNKSTSGWVFKGILFIAASMIFNTGLEAVLTKLNPIFGFETKETLRNELKELRESTSVLMNANKTLAGSLNECNKTKEINNIVMAEYCEKQRLTADLMSDIEKRREEAILDIKARENIENDLFNSQYYYDTIIKDNSEDIEKDLSIEELDNIKESAPAKTKPVAVKKTTPVETAKTNVEDKISKVNIGAIWEMYCSFNDNGQCIKPS
jgi:hypothetical protein